MTEQQTKSPKLPHSWGIANWPTHIVPNTPERARYFVRENRRALFRSGAPRRIEAAQGTSNTRGGTMSGPAPIAAQRS